MTSFTGGKQPSGLLPLPRSELWTPATDSPLRPRCGKSGAEVDAADCPDDCSGDGSWLYRDGKVLPVPVDYQAKAETTRQKLLNDADNAIKDWRTELALGIISDENKAALILWMNYINVLKSLDLAGEITFTAIWWPSLPQE